jgi:hypothetical protein
MRRLVLALLALLLVAGCATGPSQSDQDRDSKLLASALQKATTQGMTFNLDQQLTLTGGQIPSGQAEAIHATVSDGTMNSGDVHFTYKIVQGKQSVPFEMMIGDARLFVRHQGSSWKETPVASATALFPALRLELVRETVLLASSIGSASIAHIDAGFAQKYAVHPARDQLEELESIPVAGDAETQFLKTATAEIDVFLLVPSGGLGRVEIHLTGTDPGSGTSQQITSSMDVRPARIGRISLPSQADAVSPGDILS